MLLSEVKFKSRVSLTLYFYTNFNPFALSPRRRAITKSLNCGRVQSIPTISTIGDSYEIFSEKILRRDQLGCRHRQLFAPSVWHCNFHNRSDIRVDQRSTRNQQLERRNERLARGISLS